MSTLEKFNQSFYSNLASGLSRAIMDGDYEKINNILKAKVLPHQNILNTLLGEQQSQQNEQQNAIPQQTQAFTDGAYSMTPQPQPQQSVPQQGIFDNTGSY